MEKIKLPTDMELRELIRSCHGNPDKLLDLFNQYAALVLESVTQEASKKLDVHEKSNH